MTAPAGTPSAIVSVPSAASVYPEGAPTRLNSTSAEAGGVVALRLSLLSTEAVLPPVAGLIGVPRKSSSLATSVPALTLTVTVAPAHTALSGAGRHAW
ncbi:hypothetical protein D3C87_574500 [compost metagenome]